MKKTRLHSFAVFAALCIILILANITVAQRANKGKPGGGDPPAQPLLNVGWTSNLNMLPSSDGNFSPSIFEQALRPCFSSSTAGDRGSYGCVHLGGGRGLGENVFYNLPGLGFPGVPDPEAEITRNGDKELCNSFDGGLPGEGEEKWLNPNSNYSVDWDCSAGDGNCQIVIRNWFHPDLRNDKGGATSVSGAGLVIIDAFADTPSNSGDNPFAAGTLDLNVSAVEITFKAIRQNKTIAKCRYTDQAVAGISFHTELPIP